MSVSGAACGASGGLKITVPEPTGVIARDCTTLVADIPDGLVIGGHRRTTDPVSPYTGAFGRPAVLVSCGVAVPVFNQEANVETVNGVDWLLFDSGTSSEEYLSYLNTTVVEVVIPHAYLPADILPALSPLVARYGLAKS